MSRKWMFVVLAVVMSSGLSFSESGQSAATPAQKVNIAVLAEPTGVDVSLDSGGATAVVLENINEFIIGKDNNGKLIPGLASSWTISPDGKTIDFMLRKDVKFHSGDRFTAKDVEFSFQRALVKNRWMKGKLKNLDKIEIVDDYHIRFLFKAPDVVFIPDRTCTMIVSKSYYDRVGDDVFTRQPIGTGPYKLVRYEMSQYIDIERFEEYWGKKPSVREARFYIVPEDTTRMAKLQAGEVDLIQAVPYNMVKMIKSAPNFKMVTLATNSPNPSIKFSTRNPNNPWHDRRVRLAMALAIDVNSIVKNVLLGIPNNYALLSPDDLGYDPAVKPYPYDPKRAKQLLAEAGYPNGFEFKLNWEMGSRTPMLSEVSQAVASYLEAVGIRTKLIAQERQAWLATRQAANKPTSDYAGIDTGALTGSVDPTLNGDTHFACDGGSSCYCNPEYDRILNEARSTMNNAKRAELIKKMVRILREDVANIPLFNNVATYGMKKNIDFVPTKLIYDLVLIKDMTVK
jgi:peptide/nickel transport system substrate-binding protein